MATPWWSKIPEDYFNKPSGLAKALDPKMRNLQAILSDTRLADEPNVAGAFMNANVPISIAMRSDAEYQTVKATKKAGILDKNGMPAGQDKETLAALEAKKKAEDDGNFWTGVGDVLGTIGGGIKDAAVGLAHGLNYVFSPVSAPVAAENANNPYDASGAPVPISAAMDTVQRWGTGVSRLIGTTGLSATQQEDMRRAGYDPESFVSRYAWYFDGMDSGQKAVADSDVRQFSQEFDPDKVKVVREIITSNYLNDQKIEALSPAAQKFMESVHTDAADPRDSELLERMVKSSTLNPGSYWADSFGMDRGSTEANVVTAVGDLAAYWYLDPFAGAAKGVSAMRNARYGFDAGSIASAENQIMRLSVAGDVNSAPARGASAAFSGMLDQVDNIYTLSRANNATDMAKAAQLTQQFALRNPQMMGQFDALMSMRSGQIAGVRMRNIDELRTEALTASRKRRAVSPLVYRELPPGTEGRPLWRFRDDDGKLLSQAEQNAQKSKVVDAMSEFIWAEAIATGRPLHRGRALLPGEVAVNRKVRAAFGPIRDAMLRADRSVYKAFDERTGIVKFDGQFDRADEMLIGDTAGKWIAQNYTRKWERTFEKAAARFDKSFSGKTLSFTTPEGLETYRRFVVQFMPRRLAYIAVNKWATASPAERMAQWRQTAEAFENAAGFRNSPMASQLTDYLTKGRVPRAGEKNRMGPLEAYTGIRADNTIQADGHELAAGVHSYQMTDGITLPSLREIRQLQQRTGLLSATTGFFNSALTSAVTGIWKVGKVANPANLARQVAELVALHGLEQGVSGIAAGAKARRFVARETVAGRLAANDQARAAGKLVMKASGNDLNVLNKLFRSGDHTAYRAEMVRILNEAGVKGRHAQVLANLNEGVWFPDIAKTFTGTGDQMLVAMSGLDMARRVRLRWMEKTGVKAPVASKWQAYLDQEIAEATTKSALDDLSAAKDQYAMLGNENVLDDILAAADKGFGGAPARIPNSREWLGANGDRGAAMWFNEFDSRATDELGKWVQRAIALQARSPEGALISPGQAMHPKFPPGVDTPEEVAEYLIREAPEGARLRANSYRLQYTEDGKLVEGAQEIAEAQARLAQVMVRDHAYHMGAGFDNGAPVFDDAYIGILDKIAEGKRVTLDDFAKIDDELRPKAVSTSLYVPGVGKANKNSIVNLASKMYGFTVARPLSRLAATPSFLANRNVAYRQFEPVFEELQKRGFSAEQAAGFLEASASRYAVNATFRYTDEATEHSVFSELTDNFLMFQRASEDFIKRFMKVTAANPQILSRAYLLMEAAQHSGMVYTQTSDDDEGNADPHLMFTFPGSGLMAKGIQDAGRALGWGDTDLIAKPLYSSMSSQVRFINPSLSNPMGFSTSPLIGMPLRIVRSLFPQNDKLITSVLSKIEGGGETFFAEQSILQSLMPTPLSRLVPAITQDDMEGQLASATRNALIYYGAAGLLPENDATADEREEAQNAIRQMATNQLVWRAVVGLFSPMAPGYNEPEGLGLPSVNVADQARGLTSIRSEWFDVLSAATEKYGTSEGFAQANVEWLRRHPTGESILNPDAYWVGTTHAPGTATESGSAPSGPQITQWMMENKQWIQDNRAVAYYLFPQFFEDSFSAAGMRTQTRNGLRIHKDTEEMYTDIRQRIGEREWWLRYDQRNRDLAAGRSQKKVYDEWNEFEQGWAIANPATAAEKNRRDNPDYIHGTVAPALQKLVTEGHVPAGVPIDLAKQVWQHYSDYREQYNKTKPGDKGLYDRRALNKKYRESGAVAFLGTPVEDLWKALDVYEGS